MKKNIFKKVLFLVSLSFVLFGNNFIFAEGEVAPVSIPLECVAPQILNTTGDACIDIVVIPEAPVCTTNQTLVEGVCLDPVVETVPIVIKEKVVIRNGDVIIYDGFYELPEQGIVSIPDKDGVAHDTNARSVIALLYGIDSISDNFSISSLEYSSAYNSLYMKCLTPNGGESLCDNWQYTVNDSYPYVGMDKNILNGNEKIYIYFGQQNRVLLNKNSIKDNEELSIRAEKYDYENNLWLVRNGVIVGITKPDPNNPWSPNDEIQKKVDDVSGVATFQSIPEGEYNVGIKEDYYWPTEKLTVTKFIPESNGGGGSSTTTPEKVLSVSKAIEFLNLNQKSDGSFGESMYTDWVAISLKSAGISNSQLINYIKNDNFESDILTDNERRAMALMSLGINPYNGTRVNYIKKIVDSFDGIQFGDKDLVNDDIFALIVLKNAGYNNDEIIIKDLNYIISKQNNGSWGSVDMTAAGIQALKGFESAPLVGESISKAEKYLKTTQGLDGVYDNSFSNSWVLQTMYSNDNFINIEKYLANSQQTDGGLEEGNLDLNTRIWSTSYAVPAILHKSWSEIMNNFSKQEIVKNVNNTIEEKKDNKIETIEEIKKEELNIVEVKEVEKIVVKSENKIKSFKKSTPKEVKIKQITENKEKPIINTIEAKKVEKPLFSRIWSGIKIPFKWLLDIFKL